MNEQQMAQYRQLTTAGENNVAMCSEYQQAITALLAMVERLTGENANAKAALVAAAALLHQSNAEVERLTGELAAAQQEAAQVRRAGAVGGGAG